ncbi:phosphatase PAP2 family protein [Parapedobacter soli]|uniref:phosphatase PAP2 family protein n=1 Tax=Parapedobacter soli TaxID=416955 RepID=UPI0021C5CDBD|nr:phosphatase PAP2 family protein [Parapedobacter soli]
MKEFIENLLPYERDLFFLLNGSNSVFWDNVMWIVSRTSAWFPFYVFVALFLFYKTLKKEAALVLIFFILMIVVCDQFSSGLVKPFFERLRPTHHPDFKDFVDMVNEHRGGGFSFISGHATNSFGFAVFLSLVFRNRWVTLVSLVWATLISYSRIYLGVHFISDVVGGVLAGILIATISYAVFASLRKKLFHLDSSEKTRIYSPQHGKILALAFTAYFLGVVLFGVFFP